MTTTQNDEGVTKQSNQKMKPRQSTPRNATVRQKQREKYDQRHVDATLFRSVSMAASPPSFAGHGLLPSDDQHRNPKTDPNPHIYPDSIRPFKVLNKVSTQSNASNNKIGRTHSMPVDLHPTSSRAIDFGSIRGVLKDDDFNNYHNNTTKTTSSPRHSQQWRVTKLRVPPLYYPIERTAVTIEAPASLEGITALITSFLRNHSVSTIYYDDPARVECMTSNLLKFTIQLWKSPVLDHPGVVVEVQRLNGCCIEMQHLRQQLIHLLQTTTDVTSHVDDAENDDDGLEDDGVFGRKVDHRLCLECETLMESVLKSGKEQRVEQLEEHATDAFLISLSLLQSPQLNQNRLGLESLSILADQYSVSKIQAQHTASRVLIDPLIHALLQPYFVDVEVPSSSLVDIRHSRRSYDDRMDDIDVDDNEDMDRTIDYKQGRFFGAMHILSLKVLAQSLDTWVSMIDGNDKNQSNEGKNGASNANTSRSSSSSSLDVSSKFWNDVVTSCLYDVEFSSHRPLEAALSVRSLRLLTRLAPESRMKSLLYQGGRSPAMERILNDARCYGNQHHRALERETEIFLSQLGLPAH
jgi:hypothetical protein